MLADNYKFRFLPIKFSFSTQKVKQASERDFRYQSIMRNLVRRYVTVQQRKAESQGVTEDDVNEIKQDISAFRCELVEILKNSGMNTSTASGPGGAGGKKNRQKERRLMKGFNVAPSIGSTSLTPLNEHSGSFPLDHHGSHEFSALSGIFGPAPGITMRKNIGPNLLQQQQQQSSSQQHLATSQSSFGDSINNPIQKLSRFAPKFHSKRNGGSHKRKWGNYNRKVSSLRENYFVVSRI
jgi:transient receptor potential cation channel subfamily C